jgi:hypothetical protein
MKYSFEVGSMWGIRIEIHITFILLIAVVYVLSYPELLFPIPDAIAETFMNSSS